MKTNKMLVFGFALTLSMAAAMLLGGGKSFAAVKTWDGGGSDENFNTAANWNGDAIPSNGDSLVFPTSVDADATTGDDRALVNNISSLSVISIAVTGTYGSTDYDYYEISGNGISVGGNISGNGTVDDSYPKLTIGFPLTITAASEVRAVTSTSSLAIGANDITIKASSFDGAVTGSGAITLSGFTSGSGGGCGGPTTGSYPFSGDGQGFSGTIKTQSGSGILISKNPLDIARFTSSLTKDLDGYLIFVLDYGQDLNYNKPITFNGGDASASQVNNGKNLVTFLCNVPTVNKTVTITSDVAFTSDTTFNLYYADIKFTGNITGKQFIKVADGKTGKVIFGDGSTIKSNLKIWFLNTAGTCSPFSDNANNKTVVNVDCSSSITGTPEPYPWEGILAGKGKVGNVRIKNGATLSPGESPGCLATGTLAFETGATYEVDLGGTQPCSGYDQTQVTGLVSLGNPTLSLVLYNNFKPAAGQTYTIITNDGTDAITGTFLNLPEGATFDSGGYVYQITYKGGDGNDVVLTVKTVPTAPDTGVAYLQNRPVVTLIATTIIAGAVVVLARAYNKRMQTGA